MELGVKTERWKPLLQKAGGAVKKYRFPLLILLLGAALLLWPQKKQTQQEQPAAEPAQTQTEELLQTEQRLETLLSQMEGAGDVRVMLTLQTGPRTIYQTDKKTSTAQTGGTEETTTVMSAQNGSEKTPVVAATQYPVYQGAVVICQGAGSARVRLCIIEAVSSLTGLGSEKITVIKMKSQ